MASNAINSSRLPSISRKGRNHQLNNQGCKCKLCQNLIIKQMRKIVNKQVKDYQSQCYSNDTRESYIEIIQQLADFDNNPRRVKFALPEICIFNKGMPQCLISKRRQKDKISIVKNKSKLHLFQIFNFFLQGFIYHNPGRTQNTESVGRRKSNYLQLLRTQPIVLAKYVNNVHQMLNLTQVEGLFKSKLKYLKDGLLYLQTIVSSKDYNEKRVRFIIDNMKDNKIFQRAKRQIKIIIGQIKQVDKQYVDEADQINYQKQLRKQSLQEYLQYIILKIVLLISKKTHKIIEDCLLKLIIVKETVYIWDIRVFEQNPSQYIWAESVKAAYEYKLAKQMLKMQIVQPTNISMQQLGFRTKHLSEWLNKSTQNQMKQISTIRNRLQRLEKQKKSLMQSQSCQEGYLNKTYKKKYNV